MLVERYKFSWFLSQSSKKRGNQATFIYVGNFLKLSMDQNAQN